MAGSIASAFVSRAVALAASATLLWPPGHSAIAQTTLHGGVEQNEQLPPTVTGGPPMSNRSAYRYEYYYPNSQCTQPMQANANQLGGSCTTVRTICVCLTQRLPNASPPGVATAPPPNQGYIGQDSGRQTSGNATTGTPGYYPSPPPGDYTPPYIPPVKGGLNVCNDPNAWRIPQCRQQAINRPPEQPGNKGVSRTYEPPSAKATSQPDNLTVMRAMDDCLKNGLPDKVRDSIGVYYRSPRVQASAPGAPAVGYRADTLFYNANQLDSLASQGRAYTRADLLASAFAAHVFALRKAAYPNVVRTQGALVVERDNIIGFLNQCLYIKKLVPSDDRNIRADFTALVPHAYSNAELAPFNWGWRGFLNYSIMMMHGFDRQGNRLAPTANEFLYYTYDRLDLNPTGGIYPRNTSGLIVPE